MFDFKVEFPKNSNIYYLQQMGVDVWRLRDIKKKILVLIKSSDVSSLAGSLLDNVLFSININPNNFDLRYINEGYIENLDLNIYKACIILSEDDSFEQLDLKLNIKIIKTFDLHYLLINPLVKRELYKALSF